ncbi:hypothetical protein D4739_03610 [Nocardioides cavernaquae]|uniref:Uncharacterized protein n=1 Tax=Nocardioides cavernaquae TaxID=2321396 RepID=A0A3A5HBJ1_9ACTN|nr:hypothetical protein D4739_03610 [Nocardioides cavernaquae]
MEGSGDRGRLPRAGGGGQCATDRRSSRDGRDRGVGDRSTRHRSGRLRGGDPVGVVGCRCGDPGGQGLALLACRDDVRRVGGAGDRHTVSQPLEGGGDRGGIPRAGGGGQRGAHHGRTRDHGDGGVGDGNRRRVDDSTEDQRPVECDVARAGGVDRLRVCSVRRERLVAVVPARLAHASARSDVASAAAAEKYAERSLARTPETYQARLALAVAKVTEGDLPQAVDILDRLIEDYPLRPDAWVQRGIARFGQRDAAGARADLEHAIELAPDDRTAKRVLKRINERLAGQ